MLALMLADGNTLVTQVGHSTHAPRPRPAAFILTHHVLLAAQVVPSNLLAQSRNVLRGVFSGIITKRIFTYEFSRQTKASSDPAALRVLAARIDRARRTRAIVLSTPEAIKSTMLR